MQLSPLSRLDVRIVSVHRRALALLVVLLIAGAVAASQLFAGTDRHGASVRRFTIKSPFAGRSLHEIGVVPAGGGRRPLLVFLHGRGLKPDSFLSDEFYAALAGLRQGPPDGLRPERGD